MGHLLVLLWQGSPMPKGTQNAPRGRLNNNTRGSGGRSCSRRRLAKTRTRQIERRMSVIRCRCLSRSNSGTSRSFLGAGLPSFGWALAKRREERLNSPPSSFLSLSLFLLLPKTRREERGDRQRRGKKRNSLQRRKMGTLWAFQTRKLIEKKNHPHFPFHGTRGFQFPLLLNGILGPKSAL